MKVLTLVLAILVSIYSGTSAADGVCSAIAGASIIADDGEYLGAFVNKYDAKSTLNEYGQYGGAYSAKSIWNEYGQYGGKYSAKSPFNPYTPTPPIIVKGGKAIAYLSVNKNLSNALNPYVAKSCEFY